MKKWKYFRYDEFKCPCCGENKTDPKLIDMLDKARELAGVPFIINSGYRCEKHNKEVGGKSNSAHLKGKACDIACADGFSRFAIVNALLKTGFVRIGIAKTFIHVDIDDEKNLMVMWVY